jgi:hypothetical protein
MKKFSEICRQISQESKDLCDQITGVVSPITTKLLAIWVVFYAISVLTERKKKNAKIF